MTELAAKAKAASRTLALLSTEEKNACLRAMADALEAGKAAIQQANAKDMLAGEQMGLSNAMLDRLKLDDKRIAGMANGLREVAALPDPVGRILDERTRPNGLQLQKITTPIGVIVIIYESRPNVTADAASLCFKSGNATILRGGKEALHSNQIIARPDDRSRTTRAALVPRGRHPGGAHDRSGGHPDPAVAHPICGSLHAPRRRGPDPRGGRLFQGAGDQALQGRVPRVCGCARRI